MNRIFLILLTLCVLTGKSFSVNTISQAVFYALEDSIQLEAFWGNNILPIINKDKKQLEKTVHFPLEGEWGHVIELNKPKSEWTEKDFFNNLDKLFQTELIEKLKSKNYKDIQVVKNQTLFELVITVPFEEMIGDFKAESAVILRFKQINGNWKLYVYQLAG